MADRPSRSEAHSASVGYGDISGEVDAINLPTSIYDLANMMGRRAGDAFIGACFRYAVTAEEPSGLTKQAMTAFKSMRETLDRRRVGKMTGGMRVDPPVPSAAETRRDFKQDSSKIWTESGRVCESSQQVDALQESSNVGGGYWDIGNENGSYFSRDSSLSVSQPRTTDNGFAEYTTKEISEEYRRRIRKQETAEFEIPAEDDVYAFADECGMPASFAEYWYSTNEAVGWMMDTGRIRYWKAAMLGYWKKCQETGDSSGWEDRDNWR